MQALDVVRGPLQRAAGVVTLHVQTGGGGRDGEIVLTAISPLDAARLQALVGHPAEGAAAPAPELVRRLGAGGLLLAGLTAGQAGAVVAVAATVAQLGSDLIDPGEGRRDLDALQRLAPDSTLGWIEVAAAGLAAFWAIAIAGTVVAFAGFTLRREGDRLRIRRGLISSASPPSPSAASAVRIVEGVLRQPLGLAALRVETLGQGDEPPANQTLFPLVARRDVPALLEAFLPEHAAGLGDVARPPGRALRRYVLPPALVAAVPAAAVALAVDGAGGWPLLAVLPAAALGAARWSAAGWRLSEDGRAVLRRRVVARSTLVFAPARVQHAAVVQTVLQRRARLADVEVSVGPATGRVRHLEAATAWRLWQASRPGAAWPATGSTRTGMPFRNAMPASGSRSVGVGATRAGSTFAPPAALASCQPPRWPQPCGSATVPGRHLVGDLDRHLDRARAATRSAPRSPSASPCARGVVGMHPQRVRAPAAHQQRRVVHPRVVRAQLAQADQPQREVGVVGRSAAASRVDLVARSPAASRRTRPSAVADLARAARRSRRARRGRPVRVLAQLRQR